VLRVKGNQPNLVNEMTDFFEASEANNFEDELWHSFEETDGEHGQIEVRRTWTTEALDWFEDHAAWAGLRTLVVQRSTRSTATKTSESLRIFISSKPAEEVGGLARLARGHWAVENQLHWILDMAFDEDQSRARKDNAPLNLAMMRRLALGLLKRNKTRKVGVASKRLIAGWDRNYLIEVLTGL
jgi:predicted transposase YbfD/YdcC